MRRAIIYTTASIALLAGAVFSLQVFRRHVAEQLRIAEIQRRDAWIADTIAKLRSGNSSVFFYSTIDTNVMLERIAGMPEVHEITFEGTIDLSNDGLSRLPSFPNLRELDFRGEAALSDESIHVLTGCQNLESLGIKSSNVTDTGLASVAAIPKLRTFGSSRFSARSR